MDQTMLIHVNDIVAFVLFLKNKIHPLIAEAYLFAPEYAPNSVTKTHVDIMDIVARSRAMPLHFDAAAVTTDVRRDISFVAFHSFFNTNKYIEIAATAKSDVEVSCRFFSMLQLAAVSRSKPKLNSPSIQERIQRHRKAFDASRLLKNRTLIELRRLQEVLPGLQLDLNDAQNHAYPIFALEAADTAKTAAEDAITAAKTTIIANRKIESDAAAAVNSLNVFRIYLHTDIERARDASKTIRNSVSTSRP